MLGVILISAWLATGAAMLVAMVIFHTRTKQAMRDIHRYQV